MGEDGPERFKSAQLVFEVGDGDLGVCPLHWYLQVGIKGRAVIQFKRAEPLPAK